MPCKVFLPLRHCCYRRTLCSNSSRFFSSMQAWQCHNYNGTNSLTFSKTARVPHVQGCNDVLVKIEAASVNPLDVKMTDGFGKVAIAAFRKLNSTCSKNVVAEFPAIFGRDFSGTVVECGKNCSEFKSGDEVWGLVPVYQPGTHAEYTTSCKYFVSRKPKILSHVQAASVPYVCITTLSSLLFGGLNSSSLAEKRILVLGGSGGIGTFAVQWLKHKGAYVATTVSPDAVELLTSLGADLVIDYQNPEYVSEVDYHSIKFDAILDAISATGERSDFSKALKHRGKYITLTSPFLDNTDSYGLFGGLIKSAYDLTTSNLQTLQKGYTQHWAFAAPLWNVLHNVHDAYESGTIVPVIDEIFGFDEVPKAYNRLKQGHARGKIVINMSSERQEEEQVNESHQTNS